MMNSMKICEDHDFVVVFLNDKYGYPFPCPVCEIQKELEMAKGEIDDLKIDIESKDEAIAELNTEKAELETANEELKAKEG